MPIPPRKQDQMSEEDQKIYDHICRTADAWLKAKDGGEWIFTIDVDLKKMPSPHVKAAIEKAYLRAGWTKAELVERGPDSRDTDTRQEVYLSLENTKR